MTPSGSGAGATATLVLTEILIAPIVEGFISMLRE
jgi:hypothetical protein